ncbi:MAG: flavin reductase family protein [Peptococcaceae bacterium]|jgi:flavin reductase (DIM6/NTAB) family NADH-FMN oxidoreductase RutF|nr:flavin reductase family protein [Peptococcaceae bacterium]
MYYDPEKDDHGLARSPFKSCVLPRPIGWISTLSTAGVHNLAPFSQFQNLTFDPPYVMIASNQNVQGNRKDTVINIETTGEFVYNMVTYDLREAMAKSAVELPPEVDEFVEAGLTKVPSVKVKPCRVGESPIQFECTYHSTLRLPGRGAQGSVDIIIGKVVLVHIKDEFILPDGKIDVVKLRPLARLGYFDYTTVDHTFEMKTPAKNEAELFGLGGASVVASRNTSSS